MRQALVLACICLLLAKDTFGQVITIDTIFLPPSTEMNNGQRLHYPFFKLADPLVEDRLNSNILKTYVGEENMGKGIPIKKTLKNWAMEMVAWREFEITYQSDSILSFQIFTEYCGAYCTTTTNYFNYSLITGAPLSLWQVVDSTSGFREIVQKDFEIKVRENLDELNSLLNDSVAPIDSTMYARALEYYMSCSNNYIPEKFVLDQQRLRIVGNCYLPNAIKNLTPDFSLFYLYSELNKFLISKL